MSHTHDPNSPYRRWKSEDVHFLTQNYGRMSSEKIMSELGISYNRFRRKVKSLGLGYQKDGDEWITYNQIASIMNIGYYKFNTFVKHGLKVKKMMFGEPGCKRHNLMVKIPVFLKWLENNQDLWKASKIELYALGEEPEWLKVKRREEVECQSRGQVKY